MYCAGVPQVDISRELDVATSTLNDEIRRRRELKRDIEGGTKILIYDVETAPGVCYYWSRWDKFLPQDRVISPPGSILTWSAKWVGDEEMMNDSSLAYGDPKDDFGVCESLWHLFDQADIVVAHNGDRFDVKKMQTRWAFHGLTPPSPFRTYDTLKMAKGKFGMDSNRLNDIGAYFGIGTKYKHEGFAMWVKCLEGDEEAFAEMIKYNDEDVRLLERIYLRLRQWDHRHPNLNVYGDNDGPVCSKCGSDDLQITSKTAKTNVSEFSTLRCNSCGGWSRYRTSTKTREQKSQIVVSVK